MKHRFCFWLSKVKNKRLVSAEILVFLLGCISVLTSAGVFAAQEPHTDAHITVTQSGSIDVNATPGVFGVNSETIEIETNNYTGYAMTTTGSETRLMNTTQGSQSYIPTITLPSGEESITAAGFTASSWGFSVNGTDFFPFVNEALLYTNNAASDDSFNLTVGALVDLAMEPGIYEQTVTLTTVANPPAIAVSYDKNTTDTVTNMPEQDEFTLNNDVATISDKIPVRSGYDFAGWYDAVTGETLYASGTFKIDETTSNTKTYQAIWELHCTGICYDGNGDDGTGIMGNQNAAANATVNLRATNFSRPGYGFIGWNTKADGTGTMYGPNEAITMPASGRIWVYAQWVAAEQNVTMQTFNKDVEPYVSYAKGKVIALRDERDNQVYAIAKLEDGNWWMIENLRLDLSDANTTITTTNTNNPSAAFVADVNDNYKNNPSAVNWKTCSVNSSGCYNQISFLASAMDRSYSASYNSIQLNSSWYSYGVLYNWYTANADGSTGGDICPAGWHLPTGNYGGEYAALDVALGGNGDYQNGTNVSLKWRKFPNNFIYAGFSDGSTVYSRGNDASYWTSLSGYRLVLADNNVRPGVDSFYKGRGHSVRCLASTITTFTLGYDANDGSGAPAIQTGTGTRRYSFTISDTIPTLTGYDFLGWATSNTATTAEYQPGDEIILTENNATVTLYAVWASAKAILGGNNNLNFVYDRKTYSVGDTYTDNLGSTTITAVYNVPANVTRQSERPQWTSGTNSAGNNNPIASANFDQSFYDFKPTSTAYWFYYVKNLASITNIDKLNTSSVTNMSYMFNYAGYNATTFDLGNLGSWNVSSVTNMSHMFSSAGYNATTWNIGDLGGWNVSGVTNMSSMFSSAGRNATTWNIGDLGGWNVSNVTDMSYMFSSSGYNATTWNIGNLGYVDANHPGWDVSSVTDMSYMFYHAGRNATTWNIGDLSSWNVGSVTNMSYMFYYAGYNATTFDLGNLGSWNVSSVTNMYGMFKSAGYNATTWDIGNLGYVDANHLGWNVSSVTNMSNMFEAAGYNATTFDLGNLDSWNVGSVTNMSNMFYSAGRNATTFDLGNLGSWNVSGVTNMSSMFSSAGRSATTWNIGDLSSWNVSGVTNMSSMFSSAGYNATTWNIGNLGYVDANHPGWNVSSVTDMSYMFSSAGYNATTWDIGDLSGWNTANVTTMYATFSDAGYTAISWNINLSGWNTANVTSMSYMFRGAGHDATTWSIGDLSGWNTASLTDMTFMFYLAGYNATTWDIGDLSGWNTANVTTMYATFESAGYNATTWDIGDLSGWNTANVTTMYSMFRSAGCNATTWNIGDLSGWNTANVTTMYDMFAYAGRNATTWNIGDISGWNTANVTNMSYMFRSAGYKATTWNIGNLGYIDANHPGWNVSSVTNMSGMFEQAGYSATTWNIGDISGWTVTKVTYHSGFIYLNANSTNASVVNNQPHWN